MLIVSFIGYTPQEIIVGKKTTLKITLKEDSKALEEVIVIGYGTNSKRNLTSAVSTVDSRKNENVPVANITDAMAGRAAGLIVTQSGGGINKKSTISIRGGGQPIVVIDGFVSEYQGFCKFEFLRYRIHVNFKGCSSCCLYMVHVPVMVYWS